MRGRAPLQIPLRTLSSVDAYIRNREWRGARLSRCPLHPSGGCSFARHGSYARMTPNGLRIARWYCPEGRRTFSLLPDFLAARLPGLLASIEYSITVALSAKSMESAADTLRGPDVTLPGAVRWLRRRIRAVRTALTYVMPEAVIGVLTKGVTAGIDLANGCVLIGLRRSLSPRMLNSIPAPLGFLSTRGVRWLDGDNDQHAMGPDGPIADHYGPTVDGNRARWVIRPNNALPKSSRASQICSGSGVPITACRTAVPVFIFNGSSDSAPTARDTGSTNAPS